MDLSGSIGDACGKYWRMSQESAIQFVRSESADPGWHVGDERRLGTVVLLLWDEVLGTGGVAAVYRGDHCFGEITADVLMTSL
jgi:lactam utilization protein B